MFRTTSVPPTGLPSSRSLPVPAAPTNVTIDDGQTQRFVWNPAAPKLAEGDPVSVTLTAMPIPVQLEYATSVNVDLAGYTVVPTSHTFTDDATESSRSFVITAPANDENRVDDTLMVSALAAGTVTPRTAPLAITVTDSHKLPTITATLTYEMVAGTATPVPATGVPEGTEVMLTFGPVSATGVAIAATEAITITLTESPASEAKMPGDYSLSAMMATIASGATTSDMVTLTVAKNDDLGDEMLVLTGMVMGADANGMEPGTPVTVTLGITDATRLNITPKTATEVQALVDAKIASEEGSDNLYTAEDNNLDFEYSDLFNLPSTGFDISVTPTSSNPGSVFTGTDGSGIWVGANEDSTPGTSTITVTAVVSALASATISQNSANSATVMFDVTVFAPAAPVIAANSDADVMAAYMEARTAAAGEDGLWTSADEPATIALDRLFSNLPASGVTGDATSSDASVVWASVSSSLGLVLTPVGPGTSVDVTVTVGGVPVMFKVSVEAIPTPPEELRGRITEFSLAGAEEKTIDGVKRMHLIEGELTTASVTVTWTNRQLTALWQGITPPNKPDPAVVYVYDVPRTETVSSRWLSPAEGDEDPGVAYLGGRDVVFAPNNVLVPIPKKPTKDTDSVYVIATETGTTSVSLPHDDDAEAEGFGIRWWPSVSSGVRFEGSSFADRDLTEKTHVIEDDEPQGIKLTRYPATAGTIYEGGSDVKFRAFADPAREDLPLDVRYDLTDASGVSVSSLTYTLDSSVGQIPPSGSEVTDLYDEVSLNLAPNDADRMDDKLQIHAEVVAYALDSGAYGDIGSKMLAFTVVDIHKLPPLAVSPLSGPVMEGGELELTLTVDRNPANTIAVDPEKRQYTFEPLTIAVNGSGSASASDYSISMNPVAVPVHDKKAPWTQSVKVTIKAAEDEDIDAEMLTLDFVVNGTTVVNGPRPADAPASDAQASLTIQDATKTLVSVRENAYDVIKVALGDPPMLGSGMSAELMGVNLFDYDATAVSVAYATSVEGGAAAASASGGTVTVMGVSAGEAKVTITATATPTASSLVVNQTKANVAQLTFPVMVEEDPLTFMVSGPDDMNLTEGGMGGMVTVMASRAVGENTEVMLMRDGSSSASDDDYTLTPPLVTIMAGEMSGSTMVMAMDDGMAEEMEMLTLFLVVDGMQMTDKSVSFYLWDTAVPALPLIAQLLLAAFLAIGGFRRYLRR